jgi:putative DNA-invertase from lambdoid prophage Rac
MIMMRAAIWARVSSADQETGNQMRDLDAWAARRGFDVVKRYVLDDNSAFKGMQTKELNTALADARKGEFDVMLVWALDRVSREGVEVTLGWLRKFVTAGAPIWSLKESWTETADPRMAELLGSIFAWMAAEESRRRSERIRAGLARRAEAGLPVGRQPGAADKRPRRTDAYKLREARKRRERTTA